MTLFVTGVAIFALLIASYDQRGAWVAWCSTTMSIAAFMGWLLIPTVEDPTKVRAGLTWLFAQLPLVLDQQTLDDLTTAIARGSTAAICDAKNGIGCATAASHTVSPIAHNGDDVPQSAVSLEAVEANQAGATANRLAAKREADDASESQVIWLLDESSATSGVAPRFLISGINVSKVTLKKVHATLKPDATQREVPLALNVPGNNLDDEDAIPAGARFTLGVEIPTTNNEKQLGGAIFVFRYIYGGRRKATIWYFTPTMIARFGTPG